MARSHITDDRLAKIIDTAGRAEQHEVMIIAAELLARRASDPPAMKEDVEAMRKLLEENQQIISSI